MDVHNPEDRRRRITIAVAFLLLVYVISGVPRVVLYGSAVFQSTVLRLILLCFELAILVLWTARTWRHAAFARTIGVILIITACVVMTWIEQRIEASAPGSIYPPVLYRHAPSFLLALVSTLTEGIFRVALWTLAYVFPLKLDELRDKAAEAARLEHTRALSRMRASIEPSWVQQSLAEIGSRIDVDPRGAREKLAAFAEYLDRRSDPGSSDLRKSEVAPDIAAPSIPISTPSLQSPLARQRFAVAVVAIASLFALGSLPRFVEHGWLSLRLDFSALMRIVIELGLFVVIAERAARRGIVLTRTIVATLLASIATGIVVTVVNIGVEATFPGVLYPPSIFTHPTPPIRQFVRAITTAFIDVGFWTLVYLYPLASREVEKRATEAANLRREVELARLRAMLAPHFARNALNVIAGLVTAEPEQAQNLLRRLGELLCELERDEEHHSMAQEIAWLRAYAELLEARHPDLLSFRFDVDPRAESAILPRLLLQPLVENAVIHGALEREGGGKVQVSIRMIDESDLGPHARCVVEDDGPGMRETGRAAGLGQRLVRERLAARAEGGRLSYRSSKAGTSVVLEIPQGRQS